MHSPRPIPICSLLQVLSQSLQPVSQLFPEVVHISRCLAEQHNVNLRGPLGVSPFHVGATL